MRALRVLWPALSAAPLYVPAPAYATYSSPSRASSPTEGGSRLTQPRPPRRPGPGRVGAPLCHRQPLCQKTRAAGPRARRRLDDGCLEARVLRRAIGQPRRPMTRNLPTPTRRRWPSALAGQSRRRSPEMRRRRRHSRGVPSRLAPRTCTAAYQIPTCVRTCLFPVSHHSPAFARAAEQRSA